MKHVLSSALLLAFMLIGFIQATAQVDFVLSISNSEPSHSKLTLISEDEVDFITKTFTQETSEFVLQLRPKIKYSLMLKTDGFVPRMEEIVLVSQEAEFNFMHIDINHLTDEKGTIIGEQSVLIFPSPTSSPSQEISDKTSNVLSKLNEDDEISELLSLSQTKFYITAEAYRVKIKEEGDALAEFDENSVVMYLSNEEADVMSSDSYEELIPSNVSRLIAIGSKSTSMGNESNAADIKAENEPLEVTSIPENGSTEMTIEKLFFTVQLGSFSKQISNPEKTFSTNSVITQANENGGFKYYSGVYYTYPEANAHKERLVAQGHTGVFVAAFNKGERVPLSEAILSSSVE